MDNLTQLVDSTANALNMGQKISGLENVWTAMMPSPSVEIL